MGNPIPSEHWIMECEEFILPDWSPPDNLFLVTSLDFRKSIFPRSPSTFNTACQANRYHRGAQKIQNYRPRNTLLQDIFIFNGNISEFHWENYYIVHIMSEYSLDMIDLVLTNLDHCWGPLWWFDALKLALVLDFDHFRQAWKWLFWGKLVRSFINGWIKTL